MQLVYVLIILLYASIPPLTLNRFLKKLFKSKPDKYTWHLYYLAKYFFTLSFLPILFLPQINLGLQPLRPLSVLLLLATFVFAFLGIKPAIKRNYLQFYLSGVNAAFMEEILYRAVIFGTLNTLLANQWAALIISSFLFGLWHLKNIPWIGKKASLKSFFYTAFIFGPIFCLERIITGDIYLSIFHHYLTDATVALRPKWMDKIIIGGNVPHDI